MALRMGPSFKMNVELSALSFFAFFFFLFFLTNITFRIYLFNI